MRSFAWIRCFGLVWSCAWAFACSSGDDSNRQSEQGATAADAGTADGGELSMASIAPPLPDDCISDVSPGDHTFTCQEKTFQVMVAEQCTRFACGLIFDVHGAAMSSAIMRANTQLHELAPPAGYLVVHPSASSTGGGVWNLQTDPPILADFMTRMIRAFHVDPKRVHVTGFSMGAAMTFWFLCNHFEGLASAAPVTGSSADQVTVAATGAPCIPSLGVDVRPRVPILFMSGTMDGALTIDAARMRSEGLVARMSLSGGEQIDGDATFTRRRWQGADGMVLDFLEHNYSNEGLRGHCIPGSPAGDFVSCTMGGDSLHWGETALQWFVEHPKP